jgi:hypothetical protein
MPHFRSIRSRAEGYREGTRRRDQHHRNDARCIGGQTSRRSSSCLCGTQIKVPYNPSDGFSLAEIAVTPLPNGKTRIYDGEGSTGASSVSTAWTLAATGMPNVEVSSLSIATGARRLYAATHGLSAWVLALP